VNTPQAHCRQCGTCCRKGGPALHRQDLELVRQGYIGYQQLTTIRKGEPVYSPASGLLEAAERELVKIMGRGRDWTCSFFVSETSACGIYAHRPLECRLLKCWDTADLLEVVGRETIQRRDLLNPGDPVLALMDLHESQCPAEAVAAAVAQWQRAQKDPACRAALSDLVRRDLTVRHQALARQGLPPAVEFFVFGRPLFKQLGGFGITVRETAGTVQLQWPEE